MYDVVWAMGSVEVCMCVYGTYLQVVTAAVYNNQLFKIPNWGCTYKGCLGCFEFLFVLFA